MFLSEEQVNRQLVRFLLNDFLLRGVCLWLFPAAANYGVKKAKTTNGCVDLSVWTRKGFQEGRGVGVWNRLAHDLSFLGSLRLSPVPSDRDPRQPPARPQPWTDLEGTPLTLHVLGGDGSRAAEGVSSLNPSWSFPDVHPRRALWKHLLGVILSNLKSHVWRVIFPGP